MTYVPLSSIDIDTITEKSGKLTRKIKFIFICVTTTMVISSCSTWRKLDDTEKGAVIGGGTGAVVGNIISPGIGGTVVGGAVGAAGGGVIGHEHDEENKRKY